MTAEKQCGQRGTAGRQASDGYRKTTCRLPTALERAFCAVAAQDERAGRSVEA